jgi:hypothetical protein
MSVCLPLLNGFSPETFSNTIVQHVSETSGTLVPKMSVYELKHKECSDVGNAVHIPAPGRIKLECFVKPLDTKLKSFMYQIF